MNEMKLRTYTVQVELTFVFLDQVEVTAASEEEAKQRAIEAAQCDWSDARSTDTAAYIVEEEEP
jgi:hypothetical protein